MVEIWVMLNRGGWIQGSAVCAPVYVLRMVVLGPGQIGLAVQIALVWTLSGGKPVREML